MDFLAPLVRGRLCTELRDTRAEAPTLAVASQEHRSWTFDDDQTEMNLCRWSNLGLQFLSVTSGDLKHLLLSHHPARPPRPKDWICACGALNEVGENSDEKCASCPGSRGGKFACYYVGRDAEDEAETEAVKTDENGTPDAAYYNGDSGPVLPPPKRGIVVEKLALPIYRVKRSAESYAWEWYEDDVDVEWYEDDGARPGDVERSPSDDKLANTSL